MAFAGQDLSYALRSLRKQPGFTAIAVLMLALGVGANVAIFSLCHAVLFKPLPFTDPDRLMLVHLIAPDREIPGTTRAIVWSYPKYRVFRDGQRVFEATAVYGSMSWNLTGSASPERITGELVEATYFQVLGLTPQLGRTFSADESRAPGSVPLAILGHSLWTRRFGSDPTLIGRTVGLNGVAYTIVGVLPPGVRGLTGQAEVWVPITTLPAADLEEAWNHSYDVVARRKSTVSIDEAQAAAKVLGAQVDAQYPSPRKTTAWSASARPLDDERVDALIRRSLLLLLAAVGMVLLIVCINLANLMLVRGLAREREIAIRLALGASRLRIVRQLMTESALLALFGACAGVAVAYGALSAGAWLMPDLAMVLPPNQATGLTRIGLRGVALDNTVLLFTVALAIGTGALFGLVPAWRASRRGLTATMKAGSSGSVSQGTRGLALRNLLIVGEIALALVLLTAGGLMLKSVARLQATELGYNPRSLLSVRMVLPGPRYDAQRATQFLGQLLPRLAGRAEIESAAYGSCAPLSGWCNRTIATFPERPPVARGSEPQVGLVWVSPAYFDTLAIRLVRGRLFTDGDRTGQPKAVVISESAARAFWGDEDPIGRRISVGQGGFGDGAEVVGIVADVRYGSVEPSVMPHVYLPLLQSARSYGYLFVRSRTSAQALVPTLRREVLALDPDLPLTDIKMMDERYGDATWRTRMSAWLLSAFAALALLLSSMGIYGVMSQGVEQRTREIGVRMALGAGRPEILRMIIGRTFAIAISGIIAGVALAVPSSRLLTALLYQVRPGDPAVLAALAALLLVVALAAGYVPARRATRVDPLATLRAE